MKALNLFLLGLVALPVAAQTSHFSAAGSVILGLDSFKKAVNNTTGFMVAGSWDTTLGKTTIPARLSLGAGTMPGKAFNGLKTSLTLVQFSGDLLLETSVPRLNTVVGLSVNRYTARFAGDESQSIFDSDHHFPFHDCDGLKGGLRFGFEYSFHKQLTAVALLQATELAGRQRNDALIRRGALNPAWLELGLRYAF
jgi:hypothetical protein